MSEPNLKSIQNSASELSEDTELMYTQILNRVDMITWRVLTAHNHQNMSVMLTLMHIYQNMGKEFVVSRLMAFRLPILQGDALTWIRNNVTEVYFSSSTYNDEIRNSLSLALVYFSSDSHMPRIPCVELAKSNCELVVSGFGQGRYIAGFTRFDPKIVTVFDGKFFDGKKSMIVTDEATRMIVNGALVANKEEVFEYAQSVQKYFIL